MNWLPAFAFIIAVFVAEAAVIPNTKRTRTRQRDLLCQLVADTGPCTSTLRRWYFDSEADECKTFIWGGCGGNENRFRSRNRCERRCKDQPADSDGDQQQPRVNLSPTHSRRCPPLRCGESGTDCPPGSMHVFSTDASDCPICTCRPVTTPTTTTVMPTTTTEEAIMTTTQCPPLECTLQPCSGRIEYSQVLGGCPVCECVPDPAENTELTSQLPVAKAEDETTDVVALWSCIEIECAPRTDCRVIRKTDPKTGCVTSCECEEIPSPVLENPDAVETLQNSTDASPVARQQDEITEVHAMRSCRAIECFPRTDCRVIRKTDAHGCVISCDCEGTGSHQVHEIPEAVETQRSTHVLPAAVLCPQVVCLDSEECRGIHKIDPETGCTVCGCAETTELPVVREEDTTAEVHALWSCRAIGCISTDCMKTDEHGCVISCNCEENGSHQMPEIPEAVATQRSTQVLPAAVLCPQVVCLDSEECRGIHKIDPETGCTVCGCEGATDLPVAPEDDATTDVHALWSCREIECIERTDCTVIRKTDAHGCVISCECDENDSQQVLEIPEAVESQRSTEASPVAVLCPQVVCLDSEECRGIHKIDPETGCTVCGCAETTELPVAPKDDATTEVHALWSCREIECMPRTDCKVIRKTDAHGCVISCNCEENDSQQVLEIPEAVESQRSTEASPVAVLCPQVVCLDSEECRGIHKIDPETRCTVCGCADSTELPIVREEGETTEVHALWSCREIECFERTDCRVVRKTDPRTGCVVSCDCEETVEEARRDDCAQCDVICRHRGSQVTGCDVISGCRCSDDETMTSTEPEVEHGAEQVVETVPTPAVDGDKPETETMHCENQLTCHPICTAIRDERGCDVECRCEDLDGTLTVDEEEAPAAASTSVMAAEPETICLSAEETRCRCNPETEEESWSVDENGCRTCACAEVTLTTTTTTVTPETESVCPEVDCGECEGGETVTSLTENGCSVCACVMTTTTTTVPTTTAEKSEVDYVVANARKSTCSLPEERGTCRGNIIRWRYDVTAGTCVTFSYGGCRGNANNFRSERQCERFCSPHVNAGRRESRSRYGRILGLMFRR